MGIVIILLNLLACIFAPVLAPFSETDIIGKPWEPGFWATDCSDEGVSVAGPCWAQTNDERLNGKAWLGTDHLGRDLYSRLLFGARNTIGIALITVGLSFFIGMASGFMAAAMRGWVDQIRQPHHRCADGLSDAYLRPGRAVGGRHLHNRPDPGHSTSGLDPGLSPVAGACAGSRCDRVCRGRATAG